jgi:ATP phosphoribosyltransferase
VWISRGDETENDVVERLVSGGAARQPNGLLVDASVVSDASLALAAAGLGPVTASKPDFVFGVNCPAFNNLAARAF